MKDNLTEKKIVGKALLISLLYIAAAILLDLKWETNDDPAISFLLSRKGNDYSPFQWRILSVMLHILYMTLPVIDWWAVCSVFSIWISAFVTVYVILRRYEKFQAAVLLVPVLMMLWFTALYRVNFTRTAAVVAMAGALLIAEAVFDEKGDKRSPVRYGFGILLLLLGASIRKQSAMIALGFLAVIGFIDLVSDHFRISLKWIKDHTRQIGMLCLAAAVFFGASVLHDLSLTPEQEEFVLYNRRRSSIQDYSECYPAYDQAEEAYQTAGLNPYSYELLFGWTSEDTEVFTNDVLDRVIRLGTIEGSIDQGIHEIQANKLITFLAVSLILLLSMNRKYGLISGLAVTGVGILLGVYLCMQGRFPNRVYMSIVWAVLSTALFVLGKKDITVVSERAENRDEKKPESHIFKCILAGVFVVGCLINGGLGLWRAYNCVAIDKVPATVDQKENNRIYNRELCDLIEADQNHLYIYDMGYGLGSLNDAFSFWEPRPAQYSENRFCLGGWNARHPYRLQLMEEYGFDNPMRALFERTDVYSTYSPRVLRHLRNSYGSQMSVSEVEEICGIPLVQYTFWLDDRHLVPDDTVTVALNEFYYRDDRQTDAWYICAGVEPNEKDERIFFCNITVNSLRYTYQLHYEDGEISGFLYGIGEEFDPESGDICFYEKMDTGYYMYKLVQ